MSKYQDLINTPEQEIIDRIRSCGSLIGTMRSFGFPRGENRARNFLVSFIKQHSLEEEATQYLKNRTSYTIDDVKNATKTSSCWVDVLRTLGLPDHGANRNTIKKITRQNNIPTDHFCNVVRSKKAYSQEDIFCENSTYSRSSLSRVVRKYNVLEYKCVMCGNKGEWLGQKLSLVIDHINGINNDNRVDNLRYLCYNCHSLTETFAGKNSKRGMGKSG